MARIRTVKPEFWTDERLTECSLSARLMFIGMFNFADDNGNMAYSAKRLKMQIFPADNIDTQPLLDDLITHGLLIEYSVNGEKFLNIKGFLKHQLINRPSPSKIPTPEFSDDSVRTHGAFIDGEEGNGKEGKVRERKGWDKEKEASPPVADASLPVNPVKPGASAAEIPALTADGAVVPACATGQSTANTDAAEKPKPVEKQKKTDWLVFLVERGVSPTSARDWLTARGKKILSESAITGVEREASRAGISFAKAVEICAEKSWTGFNAAWDWDGKPPPQEYVRRGDKYQPRQSNIERRAEFAAGMSGKSNQKGSNDDFIDAESRVVG